MEVTVSIERNLGDYQAKYDCYDYIERMLDAVPDAYLVGLQKIVLRQSLKSLQSTASRETNNQNWTMGNHLLLANYHRPSGNRNAYIELFVDSIDEYLRPFFRIPLVSSAMRDSELAKVVFHQIGHHIHRTKNSALQEPEGVAEWYSKFYEIKYLKHWYPKFRIVAKLFRPLFMLYRSMYPDAKARWQRKKRVFDLLKEEERRMFDDLEQ